jgi:hypothetical protein
MFYVKETWVLAISRSKKKYGHHRVGAGDRLEDSSPDTDCISYLPPKNHGLSGPQSLLSTTEGVSYFFFNILVDEVCHTYHTMPLLSCLSPFLILIVRVYVKQGSL